MAKTLSAPPFFVRLKPHLPLSCFDPPPLPIIIIPDETLTSAPKTVPQYTCPQVRSGRLPYPPLLYINHTLHSSIFSPFPKYLSERPLLDNDVIV